MFYFALFCLNFTVSFALPLGVLFLSGCNIWSVNQIVANTLTYFAAESPGVLSLTTDWFKLCYWSCCVTSNKHMLNGWLRHLSPCVVSAQGSFRPPLCQTPRQFMPRTSMTSGPSPRSRACSWSTRTWSFSTSLPQGTSPSPGRRRWLRRASTGSWRCGGPTALCPTTSGASPSWSNHPSPPPARCRSRLQKQKGIIAHRLAAYHSRKLSFSALSYDVTTQGSGVTEGERVLLTNTAIFATSAASIGQIQDRPRFYYSDHFFVLFFSPFMRLLLICLQVSQISSYMPNILMQHDTREPTGSFCCLGFSLNVLLMSFAASEV